MRLSNSLTQSIPSLKNVEVNDDNCYEVMVTIGNSNFLNKEMAVAAWVCERTGIKHKLWLEHLVNIFQKYPGYIQSIESFQNFVTWYYETVVEIEKNFIELGVPLTDAVIQ